mmetsp:Transcript_31248/g.50378  ORF Transcript_31248/g.50378 Transcript_31248/m.50378 type:complete len:250 (-) Transcript_31248:158-907(-)
MHAARTGLAREVILEHHLGTRTQTAKLSDLAPQFFLELVGCIELLGSRPIVEDLCLHLCIGILQLLHLLVSLNALAHQVATSDLQLLNAILQFVQLCFCLPEFFSAQGIFCTLLPSQLPILFLRTSRTVREVKELLLSSTPNLQDLHLQLPRGGGQDQAPLRLILVTWRCGSARLLLPSLWNCQRAGPSILNLGVLGRRARCHARHLATQHMEHQGVQTPKLCHSLLLALQFSGNAFCKTRRQGISILQ